MFTVGDRSETLVRLDFSKVPVSLKISPIAVNQCASQLVKVSEEKLSLKNQRDPKETKL